MAQISQGGKIGDNNVSNPHTYRFKSNINTNLSPNPYNAININQCYNNNIINLPNENAIDIQATQLQSLNNNDSKIRGYSPSPISQIPNQSMLNITVNNTENIPGLNNEFDPYKSINISSINTLNNDFKNLNKNNDILGELNYTMNLNISVIRPNLENSDDQNFSNYPEFHQLKGETTNNNIGNFNFNNANNFEANFNDFNDIQSNYINNKNIKFNGNDFTDKEFDF